MRKGNVKILLLMLFILAGLALLFLLTLQPDNPEEKTARAEEQTLQEDNFQLAQMQDKAKTEKMENYSKKLDEYKRMVSNLEQKDMAVFKTQTRETFMELADLIDGLEEKDPDEKSILDSEETVEEKETEKIRESARKIIATETPDELVRELKDGFAASKEALEEATEEDKKMYKKSLDEIKGKIREINKENHKEKTKELFMSFHSVLKEMCDEMKKAK